MTSLDFDHLKILVADDDFQILSLVAGRAKRLSSNVVEAHDGEEALALAKEHQPDLVVLDVMMPGLSGWEVCRAIREEESLKGTRILMLTGIGERLNEMTSPLYGADDFLDKPFDFDELDARMRALLVRERS
ncbi:MAG: response regulator [Sandaracinaceae bacterium]|nr:response regulator [Sandaracinaceae bacterium]